MKYRTKTCPTCGKHFSYEVGQGNDRKHCDSICRQKAQIENRKKRIENSPNCIINGCKNKQEQRRGGYCEKHYGRMRRNGNTNGPKYKYRYKTGAGYIKLLKRDHPLADSNGNVSEHRYVLYEKYGEGKQNCFWCGIELLNWDDIVVDHLDENKQNNEISNLLLSCNNCNRARGASLSFIKRMKTDSLPILIESIKRYHKDCKKEQRNSNGNTGAKVRVASEPL